MLRCSVMYFADLSKQWPDWRIDMGCSPHRSGNYSRPSLSSYPGVGLNRLALGVKELSQPIDFVSPSSFFRAISGKSLSLTHELENQRDFLGRWTAVCFQISSDLLLSHTDIEFVHSTYGFLHLLDNKLRKMKDARGNNILLGWKYMDRMIRSGSTSTTTCRYNVMDVLKYLQCEIRWSICSSTPLMIF